jgi:hypothetical protein
LLNIAADTDIGALQQLSAVRVLNRKTVQRLVAHGTEVLRPDQEIPLIPRRVGRAAGTSLNGESSWQRVRTEKWVTDVTEFSVGGQKLYLSPY